jgi:ubiquinone/menaquinone biosynthesis C-methylase UbiE
MTQSYQMFTDGAAYERMMGRWSRLAGEQFLRWIDVPSGQRWIDVGCGNGAFTEEISNAAKPSMIVGIDPSDAQVAFARTRLPPPAAEWHVGDAQALPFPDGLFDASVMGLVISFVPDPAKAVAELARVTKPGGTVATYMWDLPNLGVPLSPLYKALVKLGHSAPSPPSGYASSREAMQNLWQDAGLQSVELTVLRVQVRFDGLDDFWASNVVPVGPLGKVLTSLSPAEASELKAELQASLPVQPDGKIAYDAIANAVKGRKIAA